MNISITNDLDQIVFTNMDAACIKCSQNPNADSRIAYCEKDGLKKRRSKQHIKNGFLYVCSEDSDHVQSNRLFKSFFELMTSLVPYLLQIKTGLENEANKRANRVIHNLKTLNAHSLQDFYALFPQDLLSNTTYQDQLNTVSRIVAENPEKAANTLMRLNKLSTATKCEFITFTKLYDTNDELTKKTHMLRRVVLNTLQIFFYDFSMKSVYVRVRDSIDYACFDYETFQVALFHLVDNAVKYVQEDSIVDVLFQPTSSGLKLVLDMRSLMITDFDLLHIYDDGYSSNITRILRLNGDGLGMGIAKKIIELNGGILSIVRDLDNESNAAMDGGQYVRNQICVTLPTK